MDHRNPIGNTLAHFKDLKLAPASNSSGEAHLDVADFGNSHMMDSRLIEIVLGGGILG